MATNSYLKATLVDLTWYDGANWTLGVPSAGVIAHINGKRSLTLRLAPLGGASAKAGELSISAATVGLFGGQLTFSGGSVYPTQNYDIELKQSATLTIGATATLSGGGMMEMGRDGTATKMRVYGTVSEDAAFVDGGQLAVVGSGHWITGSSGIAVGGANGASLVVANGGVIDEGRKGLSQWADALAIGEGGGSGAVVVTGLGSLAAFTEVYVGVYGEARLTIANGGVVQDEVGSIAFNGDGYVLVTGQGSRWDNFGGLTLGEVYPTNSTLTVTNYGEVDWGAGGFTLNDTLKLDGSAALGGGAILDGGEIEALGGHGYVYLQQNIAINTNWLFQFQNVADFSSQGGTALFLDGQITGSSTSEVRVASGDVVVNDAGNSYGFTEIYSGVLEVGATGALGQGEVEFSGGASSHAELYLDGSSQLSNLIVGFGATDKIGLSGLDLLATTSKTWTENSAGTGGTLTLVSGSTEYALNFQGAYSASEFRLHANGASGTTISFAPSA